MLIREPSFIFAFSFVVSAIFKTAKPAQGGAFVAYAVGFGLFALDVGVGTPASLQWPLLLICFVAGPVGILQFLLQEQWGGGLTTGTLLAGETPLLAVWCVLLLDVVLAVGLARYIDRLDHGVRRHVQDIRHVGRLAWRMLVMIAIDTGCMNCGMAVRHAIVPRR